MIPWKQVFQEAGAVWIHNGQPAAPHAELTSGLHSDGFVNCTFVTRQPGLVRQMVSKNQPFGMEPNLWPVLAPLLPQVDWVVGSAFGAITLASAIAEEAGGGMMAGFTEKDADLMKLARFEIGKTQRVLVVEDVISTGGSTLKTIAGIVASGVPAENILPYIVCLVNRSGSKLLDGRAIRALLEPEIHTWQPDQCPLCQGGSKALRPKKNWAELTGNKVA